MDEYRVGARVSYIGGDFVGTITCIKDGTMYIDWFPTEQGKAKRCKAHKNKYTMNPISEDTKRSIIINDGLSFECRIIE